MSAEDVAFCQTYFRDEEKRDPSITEIKMLDTYWSDHCRHTTFLTKIDEVTFDDPAGPVARAWQTYQETRAKLGREDKPVTLMDIALIGMRELRASGELDNLEVSEEVNAASIVVPVSIDGRPDRGVARHVQERDPQPPDRDRALRWCRHLPRRLHPRSAFRPFLCLSGHARHRCRRSSNTILRNPPRQAPAEENLPGRRPRLFVLRQPDRPRHRPGRGSLSPRLRRQAP